MADIEDIRLARVAQRRHGLRASDLVRALEGLDRARARGARSGLLDELARAGALPDEALLDLARIRARGRPGGHKLTAELGRGASATVYSAEDDGGHEVAVKLFRGDERDDRRAANEIDALRRLDHPAIPRFLGTGTVEGRRWLAVEKVEGESLQELVLRRGPLPWPEVVEIGLAIAGALSHAHARGVIHRDV